MTQIIYIEVGCLVARHCQAPTKKFDDQLGWTFHGHEVLGAVMVPRIFKALRLPLDHKMKYVQKLVKLHLRPIGLTKKK